MLVMVLTTTFISSAALIAVPIRVHAAAQCSQQVLKPGANCDDTKDCNPGVDGNTGVKPELTADNCGIVRYILFFTNILSALVGIVVVAVIIVAGIQYTTSAGDPQAAAAAKKRISNAILALIAFGLTYAFLQWVVPGGVL